VCDAAAVRVLMSMGGKRKGGRQITHKKARGGLLLLSRHHRAPEQRGRAANKKTSHMQMQGDVHVGHTSVVLKTVKLNETFSVDRNVPGTQIQTTLLFLFDVCHLGDRHVRVQQLRGPRRRGEGKKKSARTNSDPILMARPFLFPPHKRHNLNVSFLFLLLLLLASHS
jgi:hypothetical protein